jgi:septal ring factor EnvC (AmiA/AmiB activator)
LKRFIFLFLNFCFLAPVHSQNEVSPPSSTEALVRIQTLQKAVQKTLVEESDILSRADFTSSRIQQIETELSQLQIEQKKWQRHLIQTYLFKKYLQSPSSDSLNRLLSTPTQFDRMAWFIRKLSVNALDEVRQAQARSNDLEDLKKKQKNFSRSLRALLVQRKRKQKNLELQLKSQRSMYEQLRTQFAGQPKIFEKLLKELSESGVDIAAIKRHESSSVWSMRGRFSWPLLGPRSRFLGLAPEPKEFVNIPNKGVFLLAESRPEVRAPYSGKIILIEDNPDLGPTVYIDHGDSIWSILAGLKAIRARTGELVRKDQVIGFADRSPYHEKEGIYFELRHYGHPLVVQEWLSRPIHLTGTRNQ